MSAIWVLKLPGERKQLRVRVITGTRLTLTKQGELYVGKIISDVSPDVLIVGDCPTGIDALIAEQFQPPSVRAIHTFVANWYPDDSGALDRSAGPKRNGEMVKKALDYVKQGADVKCLGFPDKGSRGTRDCMSQARRAGIRTEQFDVTAYAVHPDQ